MAWCPGGVCGNEQHDGDEFSASLCKAKQVLATMCQQQVVQANASLERLASIAKEIYETKLEDVLKAGTVLANGCEGEAGWLDCKPLQEWGSWAEVLSRFHETLHSLKPGAFKAWLSEAEALLSEIEVAKGLFDDFVLTDALEDKVKKVALTRATGKIIRWLEKEKDPQIERNNVRSELLDLKKRLGHTWDYKKAFPKALANEATLSVAAKRGKN